MHRPLGRLRRSDHWIQGLGQLDHRLPHPKERRADREFATQECEDAEEETVSGLCLDPAGLDTHRIQRLDPINTVW